MNILFICGSAEQSKDGVGDYTRRLCGALIRLGHNAQILSICDLYLDSFSKEYQQVEDTEVQVYRIPSSATLSQRFICTQDVLNNFQPDWISLQFVPYSFHPKGLPFWLPKFLKKLEGRHQWQIMFHELWIGIERQATFKNKCVGLFQKAIIGKLKKNIAPKIVHTQAKIYQYYLSKIGIKSIYLPLFGNVAVTGIKKNNSNQIVFVVFATIHNNAPFENFIVDLDKKLKHSNESIKFVFIGRHGYLLPSWTSILEKHKIEFEIYGSASEDEISQVLTNADYGISSTPYKISDKSGVVAAMREHQLPIICIAKDWIDKDDFLIFFNDIIHYQNNIIELNNSSQTPNNSLDNVCDIFLKSISYKL